MLDEDDTKKSLVIAAIRCNEADEDIRNMFRISSGTLEAVKGEYYKIKKMIEEVRPVNEIAGEVKCSEEFVEEVKRIIETDEESLIEEVEQAMKPPPKSQGKKTKVKNVDKKLKHTGEEQAAAVLVTDAQLIIREKLPDSLEAARHESHPQRAEIHAARRKATLDGLLNLP